MKVILMGRGHLGLRKIIKKETEYKDKKKNIKHKCDFDIPCILKVKFNHKIQYYNVIKCNKCLSFISVREPGNVQGHIFKALNELEKALPLITAYSNSKYLISDFADLENVSYEEKN